MTHVSAILQHEDGTSKGCGIVEFSNPADAKRAISMLSNTVSPCLLSRALFWLFDMAICHADCVKTECYGI